MIIATIDKEKPCIFRLSNLVGNNSVDFLIELQDINKKMVKLFTAPNTSLDRDRYDRFNLTIVSDVNDEDLNNGKIHLPYGTYRYNAYVYNGGGLDLVNTDGEIIDTDQFKIQDNGVV